MGAYASRPTAAMVEAALLLAARADELRDVTVCTVVWGTEGEGALEAGAGAGGAIRDAEATGVGTEGLRDVTVCTAVWGTKREGAWDAGAGGAIRDAEATGVGTEGLRDVTVCTAVWGTKRGGAWDAGAGGATRVAAAAGLAGATPEVPRGDKGRAGGPGSLADLPNGTALVCKWAGIGMTEADSGGGVPEACGSVPPGFRATSVAAAVPDEAGSESRPGALSPTLRIDWPAVGRSFPAAAARSM